MRGGVTASCVCLFGLPARRLVPSAVCNAGALLELGTVADCKTVYATCRSATCMSANLCVNALTGVGNGYSSDNTAMRVDLIFFGRSVILVYRALDR